MAIYLPAAIKRDLKLDPARSWIVTNEINSFRWPGPDMRVLDNGTPFYGAVPDWLFLRVRAGVGGWVGRGMRVVGRRE